MGELDGYALLEMLGDWTDPNPPVVLKEHDGIVVARDDVLGVGSKVRFVDFLIGHSSPEVEEWVYGSSPASGYAQISLPAACARHGKRAVIFAAARSMDKLHPFQKKGMRLGADYRWVPNGMLPVTQARAREYYRKDPIRRRLLPMGLNHPSVVASVFKVAISLPISPEEIWTAGSSGTLSRGLQAAFPLAEVHVVSVGHKMTREERGSARLHVHQSPFSRDVKPAEAPPFPSVPNYDAKAWATMKRWHADHPPSGQVLFWNVGG